jgi:hypothetical protein
MIVSVSRRCDIPAFAGDWFSHSLDIGQVTIRSPFRPQIEKTVSLKREDVDAFVFWTRDPTPFFPHLDKLDRAGYPYYFLITAAHYPAILEPSCPSPERVREFLMTLHGRIGRERIIWRYDPIILSDLTGLDFHLNNFDRLVEEFSPFCSRIIISLLDMYPKVAKRFQKAVFRTISAEDNPVLLEELLDHMAQSARLHGLGIQSCAEKRDLGGQSIEPGRCVDERLINERFGLKLTYRKDRCQRKECLCHESVDIGSYHTCGFGCLYCYAR